MKHVPPQDIMTVEAELSLPSATARIARFQVTTSRYLYHDESAYWLDMSISPRDSLRGRLAGWRPHHFKQVGNILLIPAGHAYEFTTDGGTVACLVCQLRPDLFRNWFDADLEWTEPRLEAGLDVTSGGVRGQLLRLAGELRRPGLAGQALAELIIGQIAIELWRHCAAVGEARTSGGLAPWRLRLIDERLAAAGAAPTLAELAGLCNLSVRQLTRGFKASRGCTLGAHIARSRAELAKRLLTSDQPIKVVAHAMGFACPSSFSVAFRQAAGLTPGQFRRSVLGAGGRRGTG